MTGTLSVTNAPTLPGGMQWDVDVNASNVSLTVVATGDSDMAKALMGQRVACVPGNAYSEYAIADAAMCLPLGDHSSEDGASSFVNPMTALGFVETAKMEGHSAIVHLAAASNLGQMLNRICIEDGMKLVNIVRKPEHVAMLKAQGATHVVDSSAPTYMADLRAAIAETGAFLGFDPIGGGQASDGVLKAMEQVAVSQMSEFSRYGSNQQKKMLRDLFRMLDVRIRSRKPRFR